MTHSFTTSLDYENYLAANWLMMRRRYLWRGVARFIAILSVIYSLLGISIRFLSDGPSIIGAIAEIVTGTMLSLAVVAGLSLYWLWCIPRSARKTWPQLHLDQVPTLHEFDQHGIHISNARGTTNFEWHMLNSWTENEQLLLLFRTKLMFHAIPKTQVPSERLTALRDILIQNDVSSRC